MDIVKVSGATSKGNQPKFIIGEYFYKVDYMGYESIAEVLVSEFLSFVEGVEYIDYLLEKVEYEGAEACCCKSKIYTKEGESFISVYNLLRSYGKLRVLRKVNGKEAVEYVVESIKEITNIDITSYLAMLFTVDSIIYNEDRHFNNICLIRKGSGYRVAPVFDNGLSLLSDTRDYPLNGSISRLMRKVKSRPFNVSFRKQLGYFDFKPLVVDIDGFYRKLDEVDSNIDLYIPFKKEEYERAKLVLLKSLRESEGYLWVRK